MNIFFLDKNPRVCAKYHNDKHVVKMILETAQLLCGAHWATGSEAPYKPSHINHPCAIWTRTNIETYRWLCMLGIELSWEYRRRYLKTHKSYQVILWCCDNVPNLPDGKFFEPPLAMPDYCKIGDSAILSYRNYYLTEKKHFSKWKNGVVPNWFS
jgi:hypothetical protein